MNTKKQKHFLAQTAKDYDIPIWRVKELYRFSNSLEDFYEKLESCVREGCYNE